jgi:hypothetical protein
MMEREMSGSDIIYSSPEPQISKRIKGGLWVSLAGTLAVVLSLVVENVGMFQLSDNMKVLVVIFGTGIISQITKYLNRNK